MFTFSCGAGTTGQYCEQVNDACAREPCFTKLQFGGAAESAPGGSAGNEGTEENGENTQSDESETNGGDETSGGDETFKPCTNLQQSEIRLEDPKTLSG